MGDGLQTKSRLMDTGIVCDPHSQVEINLDYCIDNHTHCLVWELIFTQTCPINSRLIKTPLKLDHA